MYGKRIPAVLSCALTIASQEKTAKILYTILSYIFSLFRCRTHIDKVPCTIMQSVSAVQLHYHFIQHILIIFIRYILNRHCYKHQLWCHMLCFLHICERLVITVPECNDFTLIGLKLHVSAEADRHGIPYRNCAGRFLPSALL